MINNADGQVVARKNSGRSSMSRTSTVTSEGRLRRRAALRPHFSRIGVRYLRLHAQRLDKEWSLTDCISFVVMERRGISRALAHDQHFEQAGFEALLRRDPPA